MPADLDASVLVVMHIGAHTSVLPSILARDCKLDVAQARHGELLKPATIRIAPPDHHMLIKEGGIELTRGPKENFARPAIDPLFRTAALSCDGAVIGIVLTGGLDDGTAGLQAVKQCGGVAIVQDPADAVEPDMPISALRNVEVDHCVPLSLMPTLISSLAALPHPVSPAAPSPALAHENALGQGEGNPLAHLHAIGQASPFVCPDCHGGLWQLLDSRPRRYRCHTGHAFTELALQHAMEQKADEASWDALRALQERQFVLDQRAESRRAAGDVTQANTLHVAALQIARQVQVLRDLLNQLPDPLVSDIRAQETSADVDEQRPMALVVDDNETNRIMEGQMIESLGYCIRTANDGLQAIEQCRRTAPRLVLMDLDMPVMDGLAATRCLRELQARGELPPFPIVAVTADDTAREACRVAGMDGFLNKPLQRQALQSELLRLAMN